MGIRSQRKGGQALGLVKLDQKVPDEVLSKISDLEHIVQVRQIDLGELPHENLFESVASNQNFISQRA